MEALTFSVSVMDLEHLDEEQVKLKMIESITEYLRHNIVMSKSLDYDRINEVSYVTYRTHICVE